MLELLTGPRYCLGLSHSACTLVKARQGRLLAEATTDGTPERTRSACEEVLRTLPRGRGSLSVVLSSDWTRIWRVVPPAQTKRLSDLHAATAMRFQILYGENVEDWAVCADHQLHTPFLAAAMPVWLQVFLQSQARSRGLSLIRMSPHFLLAWNQNYKALTQDTWFGLVHDGVLTLGAMCNSHLETICTAVLPTQSDRTWLTKVVQRESLRLALPAPQQLLLQDPLSLLKEQEANATLQWRGVGSSPDPKASIGVLLAMAGSDI